MADATRGILARLGTAVLLVSVPGGTVGPGVAAEIVVESVKPPGSTAGVNRYGVTREDVRRISGSVPGVERVVPVRAMNVRAVYGEREQELQLIGTVAEYQRLDALSLDQGRFLLAKDLDKRNNVAVIDGRTARRLFPAGRAVGKSIRIVSDYFLIVGVLAPADNASRGSPEAPEAGRVFIPLPTMQSRYGDLVIQRRTGSFQAELYELSRVHVSLAAGVDPKRAGAVIDALLDKYHEKRDYSIRTPVISKP